MNVLTIITSYNREKSLKELLSILDKQNTDILIIDDNSSFTLDRKEFIKLKYNHGKRLMWLKFEKILSSVPKTYDYYILLPDDIHINTNFISSAVKMWRELPDPDKICLSLLSDERVKSPNWTNFKPIVKGNYIHTQWQDFCIIFGEEFLATKIKEVHPNRWDIVEKRLGIELGSGLGGQISHYWKDRGKNLYHVKESLVKHGKCESLMNPHERKINPLKA